PHWRSDAAPPPRGRSSGAGTPPRRRSAVPANPVAAPSRASNPVCGKPAHYALVAPCGKFTMATSTNRVTPMAQADTTLASPDQVATRDWRPPLELCVLGAIWGASFMLMRVAAPEFGALPLVEIRLAAGALILLPFLYAHRALFP